MFIVAGGNSWPPPLNDSPSRSGMKLCNVQPFSKWCTCRTNEGHNFLLLSAVMSVYSDGSWVTKNSIDDSMCNVHCVVQGCAISVFIFVFSAPVGRVLCLPGYLDRFSRLSYWESGKCKKR